MINADRMRSPLAALLCLLACSPAPSPTTTDAGSSSTAAATTTTMSMTSSSTTSSTSSSTTPAATFDTTTTTSDSTTTAPFEPAPWVECEPPPEELTLTLEFDWSDFQLPRPEDPFSEQCEVSGVVQTQTLHVALTGCKRDPDDPDELPKQRTLAIEIAPSLPLDLSVGETVTLTAGQTIFRQVFEGVALHRPGSELVLAYVRDIGYWLAYADTIVAPFAVERQASCEQPALHEVVEPTGGCEFVCEPCADVPLSRDVVVFTRDDESLDLLDASQREWPGDPYTLTLHTASRLPEGCEWSDYGVRMLILRHR